MAKDMFHMVFFSSYTTLGWNTPWGGRNPVEWRKPSYWQEIGRQLENACFDAIVAEDQCFIEDVYGGSTDYYVRNGLGALKGDPAVLMNLIGAATSKIGVVPTLNITEWPPYLLARMMSTMDHNTEGRAGWNMVTGHSAAGPRNYGVDDLPPHGIRYDMAAEYADLCNALWTSWDEGAEVFDRETGVYADPSKVHRVNFEGKYYKSQGPLNNSRSPQERPVMFQAGASPAGRNFSSKYADAIVGGMTGIDPMKAYLADVRSRAVGHGRKATDVKVFFQVSPIIGATMEEAKAKEERMIANAKANLDQGFVTITMTAGCDLSGYPRDMPMSKIRELASTDYGKSSLEDIFNWAGDMTLEDFVSFPPRWRLFQPVGTPDSIAGEMAEMMQEIDGDGFLLNIMGDTNRHTLAEITDGLVPALQKRGCMRKDYSGDTLRENLLAF